MCVCVLKRASTGMYNVCILEAGGQPGSCWEWLTLGGKLVIVTEKEDCFPLRAVGCSQVFPSICL